jgi:hypothetical protein
LSDFGVLTVRTTSGYVSSQERETINQLLTNKNQSKSEQPTRPVDLRDDGVDIDLPSREEIERVLKYLKNNKVAGADSITTQLLKNGGPYLVDALHAVIQQAWTGETLPRRWTEWVLCPVFKKGDKLDCKKLSRDLPLERDIQSLRQNSIR